MSPNDFAYWLQGFFEISDVKSLDEKQVAVIRKHLELVFKNVTKEPDLGKALDQIRGRIGTGPTKYC